MTDVAESMATTEADVIAALDAYGIFAVGRPERFDGVAHSSENWFVQTTAGPLVAKFTDAPLREVERFLRIAAWVDDRGIRTGRAIPGLDGDLVRTHVLQSGRSVSFTALRRVPGRQMGFDEARSPETCARVLAKVQRALLERVEPDAQREFFRDLMRNSGEMRIAAPWLHDVVISVARQVQAVSGDLTWGTIYGDYPEIFVDESGEVTGLVDWGSAQPGPLLFDIARWGMDRPYTREQSEQFLRVYASVAPIRLSELRHLGLMRDLYEVIEGKWWFERIRSASRAGRSVSKEDAEGLERVRRYFVGRGVLAELEFAPKTELCLERLDNSS